MGAYNEKRAQCSRPFLHYRKKGDFSSGFGGVFSACEAGSGPQFGPHRFGVHAGRRGSLRRRRARLFRKRFTFHEKFHFRSIDNFSFEQGLRNAFENIAITR